MAELGEVRPPLSHEPELAPSTPDHAGVPEVPVASPEPLSTQDVPEVAGQAEPDAPLAVPVNEVPPLIAATGSTVPTHQKYVSDEQGLTSLAQQLAAARQG